MDLEGIQGIDPFNIYEAEPDQQFRTIEMTMNGVTKKIVIPVTKGSNLSKPTTPPVQSPSIDSTEVKLTKAPPPIMSIQPIKIEPDDEEEDTDLCEITDVTSLRPFMNPKVVDTEAAKRGRPRKTGLLPNTVGHRVPNILRSGPGDRLVPHVVPQQTKSSHSTAAASKTTPQKRSATAGPFRSRGGHLKTGHTPISIKPSECPTHGSGQKTNVATAQGDVGTSITSSTQRDNIPTVLNMKRMMDPNLLQSIVQTLADKNMLLPQTKLVISGDSITVTNSAPLSSMQANKQAEFKIMVQNASQHGQPSMPFNAGMSVAKTENKSMLVSDTKTAGNFVQVANMLGSPKPALDNRWSTSICTPQTPMPATAQYIQSTLPKTMTGMTSIQLPSPTANIPGKPSPCVVHNPGTVITPPSVPVFLNNSINTVTPSMVSHVQQTPLLSPQQPLQAIISSDGKLTLQPTVIAPQTNLQTRMMAPQTTSTSTFLNATNYATNRPHLAQLVNGNIVVPAPNVVNRVSTPSVSQLPTIRPLYMLPLHSPAGVINTVPTRMNVPASTKLSSVPAMQFANGKLEIIQHAQASTTAPKNESNVCVQAAHSQNGGIAIRELDTPSKIINTREYQSTVNTQIGKSPNAFPVVANHTLSNSKPNKMDLGPIILNGQSLGTLIQQNTVKRLAPKNPRPAVTKQRTFVDTGLVNIAPKPGSSSNLLQKLAEAISELSDDNKGKPPIVSSSTPASESEMSLDDDPVSLDPSIEKIYTQQYKTLEDRWAELFGGKVTNKKDESVKKCYVALQRLDMQGKTSINIRDLRKMTMKQSVAKTTQSKKREIELLSDISESSETDDTEEDDYFEALRKERLRKRQQAKRTAFYHKMKKHKPEFV